MQPSAEKAQQQLDTLRQSIAMLATNHSFQLFIGALRQMKEDATDDACRAALAGNVTASQAALGGVHALEGILALVRDYAGDSQVVD